MIKSTAVAAFVLCSGSSLTLAQYDARDANVIDLLSPPEDAGSAKRRCTVVVNRANIPCNHAWYIQFKNGSRAIQFNQMTDESPVVSLFGTESSANKLSIGNVLLRLGDRSAPESEMEAGGECILREQEIHCDVKARDGRHIVVRIVPR